MDERAFVIGRDARGSVVHVRRRDDAECIGCVEVGLFEIVRALVLAEHAGAPEGTETPAVSAAASVTRTVEEERRRECDGAEGTQ